MSVRVLHLLSNFKWTGPAEPAVSLAVGLRQAGVDVVLRTSGYTKGGSENWVRDQATARGLAPVTDLLLSKHRALWRNLRDVRHLRRILDGEKFDIVHCHLPNDTRIARAAVRGRSSPRLVRTLYDTEPDLVPQNDLGQLRELERVFVFSRRVQGFLEGEGMAGERLVRLETTVDLERFRPGAELANCRGALGFDAEDFVAGIVARVQPQRRFDLLLDAAELVARECPRFRLVIVGRGSKLEATARTPARERGLLEKTVFFPGYFEGEDYPAVLRSFDVKVFLVPGTDGTARAVREALACGVPAVTTRRGMLGELVRDGVTGRLFDETPEALAAALLELWRDPEGRRRMGAAARADACERFDRARQVETVRAAYATLLGVP